MTTEYRTLEWINGQPVVRDMTPEEIAAHLADAQDLAAWRASAKCSPMQGKLALGQAEWAKIEAYRDTEATWAQRIVIDSAQEWRRNSQDIQFFGYLLGYDDAQMDQLFTIAMQIAA